jgi:hypothetical protein
MPERRARAVGGAALLAAAAAASLGCGPPDHLANLEPARKTVAAYLEAWRTLDFRTMYGLTAAAALGGATVEQYENTANQTLLENAVIASHMRYAVGAARTEREAGGSGDGAAVELSWTIPNMARAVQETAALVAAGVGARGLLDALAPKVADGTVPLETHAITVRLVWEEARWKVDPASMKVASHAAARPGAP